MPFAPSRTLPPGGLSPDLGDDDDTAARTRKTHLSAVEQMARHHRCSPEALTDEQVQAQGKAGRIAASLLRMDLVILDELGYLPSARPAGHCCSTCSPSCTSTPA